MKSSAKPQSATSLPRAPRDDARTRVTKYVVMMTVRVVCFLLMVLVTPYSWYTWLFAVGAVFLPYIAVVIANVGDDVVDTTVEHPDRTLGTAPTSPTPTQADATPTVIRIAETPPRREPR